jgi:hypothetical protein
MSDREEIARIIYSRDPLTDSGEAIDGFQVSSHSEIAWDDLCEHGEDVENEIKEHCFETADAILAALSHEWRPISDAPKAPANGSKWWGPKILISTTHHGHQVTFIGRFHHGAHKRFMDTADGSCVSAGDDGDLWIPLPTPPATGGDGG